MNRREMSQLLQIAKTTLDDYLAAGMPGQKGENGEWEFDPAAVIPWYRDYLQRSVKRSSSSDYQEAKIAKLAAEAELAQMKVEVQKGELVPVEFAAKVIGEVLAETRSGLLSIPHSISQEIAELPDAKAIEIRIETALFESMTALQDKMSALTVE